MPKNVSKKTIDETFTSGSRQANELGNSERKVRLYDFAHPDKLSRTNLRALQMIFGGLEKSWGYTLSDILRNEAKVQVNTVTQLSFGQLLDDIQSTVLLAKVGLDPLPGGGFVYMPTSMALSIVDCMTGGEGSIVDETRKLTQIEQGILRRAILRLLGDLQLAWQQVATLEMGIGQIYESCKELELDRSELVLGARYSCSLSSAMFDFGVVLPVNSLSPVLDELNPRKWLAADSTAAPTVSEAIMAVELPVTVHLGKASISVQDVLSMEVGDVIRLDSSVDSPVVVRIGDKNMFHAVPGLSGRRLAVRLVERIAHTLSKSGGIENAGAA